MPVETRLQLVLAVLAHEMTVAEAARRHGVSGTTVSTSQTGLRAQGVVVSSGGKWISGSNGGGMTFHTVVQFTPVDGDIVEFRSKIGVPFPCKPGRPVPVCYRASRPQSAVIDTFSQAWLTPLMFVMIGMVGVAIGF